MASRRCLIESIVHFYSKIDELTLYQKECLSRRKPAYGFLRRRMFLPASIHIEIVTAFRTLQKIIPESSVIQKWRLYLRISSLSSSSHTSCGSSHSGLPLQNTVLRKAATNAYAKCTVPREAGTSLVENGNTIVNMLFRQQ